MKGDLENVWKLINQVNKGGWGTVRQLIKQVHIKVDLETSSLLKTRYAGRLRDCQAAHKQGIKGD